MIASKKKCESSSTNVKIIIIILIIPLFYYFFFHFIRINQFTYLNNYIIEYALNIKCIN